MAIVTNHGKKRIKERAGLPKKAVQNSAERALHDGIDRTELSGSLRRYVDYLYYHGKSGEYRDKHIKIYGNMVYIFDRMVLITAFNLPGKYIKTIEKVKEKVRKRAEEDEQ